MPSSQLRSQFTDAERAVISRFLDDEAVHGVLASAVAQGMHSPFSLDCDYWGRQYAQRLDEMLDRDRQDG